MKQQKVTLYVQGMTCVSCEIRIKDELKEFQTLTNLTINHKSNKIEFDINTTNDLGKIRNKIEELGYKVFDEPFEIKNESRRPTIKQWIYALIIVFILYYIFISLQKSGLLNALDTGSENIGYGAAFIIGIVASLSTCLAIIGAVVMSFGAKYETKGTTFQRIVKPHVLFHIGRISTFFILGGILGLIGSVLKISPILMAWFSIIIALTLIWLAFTIIGLIPSMTKVGIHMPKKFLKHWDNLKKSEHTYAPIILGALTFFLPCGFTQSMQLFAMGSGDFWVGGITLALFALGTTPVLLGIGVISSKINTKENILFKLIIGIIIALFGWYSLASGFAVLGITLPSFNINSLKNSTVQDDQLMSVESVQTIYMTVDYTGYTPNTFTLQKNKPVRWIINVTQITGCTNEIIVPSLNISKPLKIGQNIITFTPTEAGSIGFSCWMGMVRGTFNIK